MITFKQLISETISNNSTLLNEDSTTSVENFDFTKLSTSAVEKILFNTGYLDKIKSSRFIKMGKDNSSLIYEVVSRVDDEIGRIYISFNKRGKLEADY